DAGSLSAGDRGSTAAARAASISRARDADSDSLDPDGLGSTSRALGAVSASTFPLSPASVAVFAPADGRHGKSVLTANAAIAPATTTSAAAASAQVFFLPRAGGSRVTADALRAVIALWIPSRIDRHSSAELGRAFAFFSRSESTRPSSHGGRSASGR